jgi:hypothetical protein
VYFPRPARDKYSGLTIASRGCHDLDGDQALAYVRSRYYEYKQDGEWRTDPLSDLGRINRQQYFIRTLAQTAIHSVVSNPLGASDLADKSVAALTRDKTLGTADLQKLVRAFRSTDPTAYPMVTLPATNGYMDGQSVLLLDAAKAAPILGRLRGEPAPEPEKLPDVQPASVRVTVENGSGVSGAAAGALGQLNTDGFAVGAPASDADRSDYAVTEVRYAPGNEKQAQLVLAYLGGAGKVVPYDAAPKGLDVIVVLGDDFTEVSPPVALQAAPIAAHRPAADVTTATGPAANPGGPMPVAGCP